MVSDTYYEYRLHYCPLDNLDGDEPGEPNTVNDLAAQGWRVHTVKFLEEHGYIMLMERVHNDDEKPRHRAPPSVE